MGHSQAEKAASRERILDAAARQIRESGIESISIAELMKAANLTHGGFYGHFPSRSALIEAAVERAMTHGAGNFMAALPATKGRDPVKATLNSYLSTTHRDNKGVGCALGAIAGDAGRSDDPAVRKLLADRLEQYVAGMTQAMGGGAQAEAAALTAWSTMIGAITLSRLMDGPRSDEILKTARQSILDLADRIRAQEAATPQA